MGNLRRIVSGYRRQGRAIGHFNVANWEQLAAVAAAAKKFKKPVIIGVSESERAFWGVGRIAALIRQLREKEKIGIFLNADHTRSLAGAVEAARAGFDSITVDFSFLPLAENVNKTRVAALAARKIKPDIVIEGELGNIGDHSSVKDWRKKPELNLTDPAEAAAFVKRTAVDWLAPSVGNLHGIFLDAGEKVRNPRLNIILLKEIGKAISRPMVLHGGSGNTPADWRVAARAGAAVIHISTEFRLAWRRSLEKNLRQQPGEIAPHKIADPVIADLAVQIEKYIKTFSF